MPTRERERESKTTPQSLLKPKNLFIFSNAISSQADTSATFENLLNYSNFEKTKPWYQYHNMIDIFKLAHYETFWLEKQELDEFSSTQSIVSSRSKERHFILGQYDENLLSFYTKNIQPKLKDKNFIVFHLLGSHPTYSKRFPQNFAKFKPSDLSFSHLHVSNDKDKQIVADYVNSLYYNDYILNEIFNLFKDKDAIVFYLSDHAQDIFESGSTFGHKCSKYGVEIPFMIYVSDIFKERHPEKVELIKQALNKPFMSDDLIHSLLPLVGIHTKDEIESKNLFSPKFDATRKRVFCNSINYDAINQE